MDSRALKDIPLKIKVVVGTKTLTIEELQAVKNNEVLQLDQLAGTLAEVYANDKLIAYAEIVLMGEHFGIKIKELVLKKP